MPDYITIDVHCVICKESIKPSEADMELFRVGVPVHNVDTKPECQVLLEKNLDQYLGKWGRVPI